MIGRPIVGVIMGSVVFLAVATSLSAIGAEVPENAAGVANTGNAGQEAAKPYLLWALAFIGGFSDKFAILLFDNLVGKFTSGKKLEGENKLTEEEELAEEEFLEEENLEEELIEDQASSIAEVENATPPDR